jgi:hypothetical protein
MSPARDRGVDALRLVATVGVVLGHWLVTAPTVVDGVVRLDSPLRTMPALAPASWLLQTLGVFFLVAGFGAARGWSARDTGWGGWWWLRVRRLAGPVGALVAVVLLVAVAAGLHGAAQSLVRVVVLLSLSPLWFLGVHLALLAATPLLVRLDSRFGAAAAAVPATLAVLAPLAGDLTAQTAVLTAWWVPWQLGIALSRRPLPRPGALLLLAGGVAGVLVLVLAAGFPATAVGVRGALRSNLDPPSAATVCLALAQAGLCSLALPRLGRLALRVLGPRVPDRWVLPAFLLHLPVLVALWLATLPWAPLPGLHDAPADAGWLLARAGWVLAVAGVLVAAGPCRRLARSAGDALPHRAGGDRLGHGEGDPPVQRAGNDVVGPRLVADHVGDGGRGSELHPLGDPGGAGVDGPAEDPGEGQHVVDLVGLAAAAGGDDGGVPRGHHRVHLGDRVGQ